MDTSKLKKFASFARTSLIEQVGTRLKTVLAEQSLARRENATAVAELEKKIKELGKERVIEMVAYTWFNRFCALRFMDVNGYTTIGTVSPAEGFTQPEILTEAKQGVIDEELKLDRAKIIGVLDGTRPSQDAQGEVYQQLLIAVCNSYHKLMPFMFEKIADYTELLIPEDLLSDNSVLAHIRNAITLEDSINSSNPKSKIENPKSLDVEVIGWLYQFYISEKKDEVFAALKKGKKITSENIPAATQLFTPHWIVRYLVENSLGRLWMLNHPDSKLVERMDYYIKPEEPETDFLRIASPEEIKVCDPACGSGHMLTYAFDLLYAIYEEQGYQATDIPRLILKHNLYGVEIDQRAGALAAFALVMKAREKDRRFFSRKPLGEDSSETIQNPKSKIQNPNVCVLENISIDPEDLSAYMDKVGRDLFSGGLQGVVNQWEEADNFGSLIRPLVTDVSDVLDLLRERQMGQDLFLASVHQKVLKALWQADYLSPKYHVVVANPPYMGNKGMNASLKSYLMKHYPTAKSDLYTAFINCFLEGLVPRGFAGVMSPITWMFIGTYKSFRSLVLEKSHFTTLVQPEYHSFFDSAFVPICAFVLRLGAAKSRNGVFINLEQHYGADLQEIKCREAIADKSCKWRYSASTNDFQKIPNSPILYWASKASLDVFARNSSMAEKVNAKNGITTGDNEVFLRSWHEVAKQNISFDSTSRDEALASGKRWFPNNKGGQFRKWWGNHDYVLNWFNDGQELKAFHKSTVRNIDYFFKKSVSWSDVNMKTISFRMYPEGFCFDAAVNSVFPESSELSMRLLSATNNKFVFQMAPILNPTMHFKIGDFGALPGLLRDDGDVTADVERMIEIAKQDWDSFETSWAFEENALIAVYDGSPLDSCFHRVVADSFSIVRELRDLEQKNNRHYISAYGLEDELSPDIPVEEITLTRNPRYRYDEDKSESELEALLLADTMREFISYAVGCMFGRYSLDKPGLILANQGETVCDYRRIVGEYLVMSNERKKDGDRQLSGLDSVAEGDGRGGDDLSSNQTVSKGGDLRTAGSDSTSGSVHSIKHSGRSRAEIDRGLQKVPSDRSGIKSGSGNTTSNSSSPDLPDSGTTGSNHESAGGSQQDEQLTSLEAPAVSNELPETSNSTHNSLLDTQYSFLPDEDNVIPLLDGDWFEDDITERFKAFLKVTFGTEHYEENLTFLENALYPDNLTGKKRKTIRDYFLKDFYNHHIKLYKKRPIYWLFSSPKGTFNALIYMHRYRPDTVGTVLHYLRDFRDKLTHRADHQQMLADSASASKSEKTQAIKDVAAIKKQLKELEDYEKTLFEVAARKIDIDLDDGVKHNYLLFGSVLRKIPGLDAKED